ncbi:MAG: hypothetical protein C0478_12530 [Planctomyces sp.]|nr:hypothetical protein [Planctomyces sp.]
MRTTDGRQRLGALIESFHDLQERLQTLLDAKWAALVGSRLEEADALLPREESLVRQLQAKAAEREDFLRAEKLRGSRGESLLDLAREWGEDELISLAEEARRQAGELQQFSWRMWILTQRGIRHLDLVVDAVARGGLQAPTYDGPAGSGNVVRTQSALLDVSL